jgi:hypothetical protein
MASGDTIALFSAASAVCGSGASVERAFMSENCVLPSDSVGPSARFTGLAPRQYSRSGLTVVVAWYATEASGVVRLSAAIDRLNPGVILSSSTFATAMTVQSPVPATARRVEYTAFALSNNQSDQVAPGDLFAVKITRDNTADGNAACGVNVMGVTVKET